MEVKSKPKEYFCLSENENKIFNFIVDSFTKLDIADFPSNEWRVKCPAHLLSGLVDAIEGYGDDLETELYEEDELHSGSDDYSWDLLNKAAKFCRRAKKSSIKNVVVAVEYKRHILNNEFFLAVTWNVKNE